MVEYAVCSMLLEQESWSLAMLQLEETQRPITSMRPGIVSVVPFHIASEPQPFWPSPVTTRRRTSKPSKKRPSTSSQHRPLEESGGWAPTMSDQIDENDVDEGGSISSASDPGMVDDDVLHDLLDANVAEGAFNVETFAQAETMEESAETFVPDASAHSPPRLAVPEVVVAEPVIPQDAVQAPVPPVAQDLPEPQAVASVQAPAPPRRSAPRGPNTAAAITVLTDHGTLAYYPTGGFFEAVCRNPSHLQCKMRRTSKGRTLKSGEQIGGRPLGFLMHWLKAGATMDQKHLHWVREDWANYTVDERQRARETLSRLVGGPDLMGFERDRSTGEPEEPTTLRGYLG